MLNNETLGSIIDLTLSENSSMIESLVPYLPAMKRCGTATFNTVVEAIGSQDWSRVDRELYEHMTEDERDALSAQILQDARKSLKRVYETRRTYKSDLLKAALGIAVSLV
jgi:hypothetical protein